MASITKTACRFLLLTLFVISAAILPTSVCHGARLGVGIGRGALEPDHPAVCGMGEECPPRGRPYFPFPRRGGGPGGSYPETPLPQLNGEKPRH
ncbi:hypothetical protein BDA96_10G234100 [Sorghum bicolor]|uniref:Uncharacterized protein n=2 Tax=Sorghum bicolor TaxID=4558 RepID=A0A921Q4R5_SORBI|nr:hypothetical protein BDA96_10G234100 [Sorghum bicolor]KXG20267.1 hypothetical protein SORBI_3010G178000 [Sorghum bicolor]